MRAFENPYRVSATTLTMLALCIVLLTQNTLPIEFTSPFTVLLGLIALIMTHMKIRRSYLKLTWPLMGVLVIGIVGVFNHQLLDILRDVSFALTPISLIFIGFWAADNKKMWPLIFKIITICGFILAIIHLSAFIQDPTLLGANLEDVRRSAGVGSGSAAVLSLVIGLFQYRLGIGNQFPKFLPRFIALPVLLASFMLSYSRTEFVMLIVLSLALFGWVIRVNLRLMAIAVAVIVGIAVITVVTPENEEGTFRSKLVRSTVEVAVSNYEDQADINNHWRGFETYRALVSFLSGDVVQQIFGQGFGALVDLGFVMDFGKVVGVQLRYIPVLHNGYAYVLIKTGLLGIVLYVIFYINIIKYAARYSNYENKEQRFLARLLLGCVLTSILLMFVVEGMAEAAEPALVLLLGYLVRRISQFRPEISGLVNGNGKE